jgi:hypothetical protein
VPRKDVLLDGYKVVGTNDTGHLVSCYAAMHYTVTYTPGEAAFPVLGEGPLCVFTSLSAARSFSHMTGFRLYSCSYKPSRKVTVWHHTFGRKYSEKLAKLPSNTGLADYVVLKEQIY